MTKAFLQTEGWQRTCGWERRSVLGSPYRVLIGYIPKKVKERKKSFWKASWQSLSHLLCSVTLSQHQERRSWKTLAVGTWCNYFKVLCVSPCVWVYSAATFQSCLGLRCSSLIVLTWCHLASSWLTENLIQWQPVFTHKCAQVRVRLKVCLTTPDFHTLIYNLLDYFISPFLGEKSLALWWLK